MAHAPWQRLRKVAEIVGGRCQEHRGPLGGIGDGCRIPPPFVPEGLPWIHLDIAGVAKPAGATVLAPKGATGWGVMALDRMIREMFDEG